MDYHVGSAEAARYFSLSALSLSLSLPLSDVLLAFDLSLR